MGELRETDWNHELAIVGSEDRAPVLVAALDATRGKKEKETLLREWFYVCEAIAPQRHDLRRHFADVGWVTDSENPPEFPVTVYRAAWEDDDVATSLSWTMSREFAERFARGLTSMRAKFLGYYRDDVVPYIWQATCLTAFAYFDGRDEQEVVPETLDEIVPIAMLVKEKR